MHLQQSAKIRSNFFKIAANFDWVWTASFAVTVNTYVSNNLNFSIEERFFSVLKRCTYVTDDDFKL